MLASTAFRLLTVACVFATRALALDYTIQQPFSATTWQPGQTVDVKWSVDPNTGSAPNQVTLTLMDGSGDLNNARAVTDLGTVDVAAGSATIKVPDNLPGGNYFIRMGADNYYKYSAAFPVSGAPAASADSASSPAPTTDAPATSSPPSETITSVITPTVTQEIITTVEPVTESGTTTLATRTLTRNLPATTSDPSSTSSSASTSATPNNPGAASGARAVSAPTKAAWSAALGLGLVAVVLAMF